MLEYVSVCFYYGIFCYSAHFGDSLVKYFHNNRMGGYLLNIIFNVTLNILHILCKIIINI